MFDRIIFYYDQHGTPLAKPRELTISQVNAISFSLSTCNIRRRTQNSGTIELPGICIERNYGDLKQDPYNEDGRPPCSLFFIANPHTFFIGNVVEIVGWEI